MERTSFSRKRNPNLFLKASKPNITKAGERSNVTETKVLTKLRKSTVQDSWEAKSMIWAEPELKRSQPMTMAYVIKFNSVYLRSRTYIKDGRSQIGSYKSNHPIHKH